MLTIVKQSYLPYLLLTIIGSLMEGICFILVNGFYVTHVLKVCIYIYFLYIKYIPYSGKVWQAESLAN